MEKAKVEFIVFDSADVIATSGEVKAPVTPVATYGFNDKKLYRYDNGTALYNTYYTGNKPSGYDYVTTEDRYAHDFWIDVWKNQGDDYNGYSTQKWTDVSKWLILNSDNSWSLADRTLQ